MLKRNIYCGDDFDRADCGCARFFFDGEAADLCEVPDAAVSFFVDELAVFGATLLDAEALVGFEEAVPADVWRREREARATAGSAT
jgi:hypothetical protein